MNRTERTLDLMLDLQRWPRTFEDIQRRYPGTSERTLWRCLADIRRVADLQLDDRGRYAVPVRTFKPMPFEQAPSGKPVETREDERPATPRHA